MTLDSPDLWLLNGGFFALACACLVWARLRTRPGPPFPGPVPVGSAFKAWLLVIWGVGLLLPIAALVLDGFVRGVESARLAMGFYILMVAAQVATELFVWKRWRSPVWVLVPCLYLPWRLFQVALGLVTVAAADAPFTAATLWALLVLWIVNIGVHYTNIPNTLRWDHHPGDSRFPSLRDPRVFVKDAQ